MPAPLPKNAPLSQAEALAAIQREFQKDVRATSDKLSGDLRIVMLAAGGGMIGLAALTIAYCDNIRA